MSVEYEYINFKLAAEGKKTNVYHCHSNRNESILGFVRWYGAWRQYCFYPEPETIFNKGCLNDNYYLTLYIWPAYVLIFN